ncbi:Hypothetical predicted protein [Mytilus galloprovincialis]|uniref:C2H2-type domain-containing protein n=1 Tax=Mytilus galloprovincialis TaxID=29158 RepID=A0A8B6FMV6_MYTGA|nr:Hypothetical predicted protein [Mytilus galloprovincialis]
MEESQVLTDIINCFTSIDQLLTFAHTYGLQDDPTVQLRLAHLRRQTSPLHIKCTTCGELFRDREKYDLHVVYHETIRDFDLNVFDEPHSVSIHVQTINPHKRKTSSLVPSTDTIQGPPPTKKKKQVFPKTSMVPVKTPLLHTKFQRKGNEPTPKMGP